MRRTMRPRSIAVTAAVCASAALVVTAVAQDKPPAKPAPAPITLKLGAGDVLELTETETVVVRGQSQFTATAKWHCSALVDAVRPDGSVALTLRCDRFEADQKTDFTGKWAKDNLHYQIDTDVKPGAFILGDAGNVAGLAQLARLGGQKMTFVLAADGVITETKGELRPTVVEDDRSDEQKAAAARSEILRFFPPLPAGAVTADSNWTFERWFAPTPYDIQFRAVGPVTEEAKGRSLTPAEFKCEFSSTTSEQTPKNKKSKGKTNEKKKRKAGPTLGVSLSEWEIKGTATFDVATGLCTARSESFTATTVEVFGPNAVQPLDYKVTTEMTCRRSEK